MCPPVRHVAGDGIPDTSVPPALEAILREQFAVLSNSISRRSIEIDKTLAELRVDVVALQTASMSSVETRSARSDWPLPKFAGSKSLCSNRRPSQNQASGEGPGSPVISKPVKRQTPFSPSQKAHTDLVSARLRFSSQCRFLSDSLVAKTRTPSISFVMIPSPVWKIHTRSSARKAVTMPALFLSLEQHVTNSLLLTRAKDSCIPRPTRWPSANLPMPSFVRPVLTMSDRWGSSCPHVVCGQ